ncbi:hypothetical protein EVJ50_14180 [Synechococcus sp. RSCCF101]|uniref:hypothetical protein n=1 Tax=Synechococcus sp. RSCCF101 TaxID=2511069 RepID=UPI00124862A3|nr:hypothetical protein [Synechococcus sp. RSCCF101]QEY33212.1 hypothetical protein EVJ50_14180 [Synechococcus sp. RSCCF101]
MTRPAAPAALHRRQRLHWDRGFSVVEPLLVVVLISIAAIGASEMWRVSNRQRQRSNERIALNVAIDSDLARIQELAAELTCCSGACTMGIPSGITPYLINGAATGDVESPCATDNPLDDRYFFPRNDNPATTTVNEPDLVSNQDPNNPGLCERNEVVDPLISAIEEQIDVPAGATRTITKLANNRLLVTYGDASRDVEDPALRIERITPPMALFCS